MKPSSKFYSRSLTFLLSILKLIESGNISSEIAISLGIHKSHLSYYVKKAKSLGYVKEINRDIFKPLELTSAGKNFLTMYSNSDLHDTRICRAENLRFKAEIVSMPSIPVDWRKMEMNNWDKYRGEINGMKVHINQGNNPSIEFIPPPLDGDNPDSIRVKLLQDCMSVAKELEDRLGMKIGSLQLSAKGEWVVYDRVAKAFSKKFGQTKVDGTGKVNASKPKRQGEFEFEDPRTCADYMAMPRRLSSIEERQCSLENRLDSIQSNITDLHSDTKEIKNLLNEKNKAN